MRVLPFFKPRKGWHVAGTNLEPDSGGGGSYVLPVASADTLGGVKVGSGLSVESDGTLSASGGGGGGGGYTISSTEANTGLKFGSDDIYVKLFTVNQSLSSGSGATIDDNESYYKNILSATLLGQSEGAIPSQGLIVSGYGLVVREYSVSDYFTDVIVYYTKN